MPDLATHKVPAGALMAELQASAQAGDWGRLEELTALLPQQAPPQGEVATTHYLFALRTAIFSARTARADIVKSLHRLTAASSFNQCG